MFIVIFSWYHTHIILLASPVPSPSVESEFIPGSDNETASTELPNADFDTSNKDENTDSTSETGSYNL